MTPAENRVQHLNDSGGWSKKNQCRDQAIFIVAWLFRPWKNTMRFKKQYTRRGVINVWVALSMFMIIALVGLACDTGWCTLVLNQLQSAADAAALAGAQKVKTDLTLARTAARDIAHANKAANHAVNLSLNTDNAVGGDIVVGTFNSNTGVFTATTSNPNAVKVIANRTSTGIDRGVPLVFGPIFRVNTVDLSATAIAIAQSINGSALLVLDPTGSCALDIAGGPTVTVTGGDIQVNSSNTGAVCNSGSSGTAQISAPALNVVGGTNVVTTNAPVYTGMPVVPDPLAALPAPPNGQTWNQPSNGNVTIQQGYYPSGIRRSSGTLTLNPGIYVIDNAQRGFSVSGTGGLIGNQIMIYMKSGALDLTGGGTFVLSPPTSGTYKDVTIFQARNNLESSSIRGGNSLSSITGTLYFPNNFVTLHGNSPTLGNQIIAFRIRLGGNSAMNVPYTGAFPTAPPSVFLVN